MTADKEALYLFLSSFSNYSIALITHIVVALCSEEAATGMVEGALATRGQIPPVLHPAEAIFGEGSAPVLASGVFAAKHSIMRRA